MSGPLEAAAEGVGNGPRPITKQRSTFEPVKPHPLFLAAALVSGVKVLGSWQRNVHDGHLTVIITNDGDRFGQPGSGHLHMSISHRTNSRKPRPGRYPVWDEISHARYELLPLDRHFAMVLPPPDSYVALHDTTFHLHETNDPHLVEATGL